MTIQFMLIASSPSCCCSRSHFRRTRPEPGLALFALPTECSTAYGEPSKRDQKPTYDPIKSMSFIPCIFFCVSAISLAISGSISILAMIFGMKNIMTPLNSIMSTMGFLSMPMMFTPGGEV